MNRSLEKSRLVSAAIAALQRLETVVGQDQADGSPRDELTIKAMIALRYELRDYLTPEALEKAENDLIKNGHDAR